MAKLTGVLGTLEEIAKASKEADALIAADKARRATPKMSKAQLVEAGYYHPIGVNKLPMPVSEMSRTVIPDTKFTAQPTKYLTPMDLYKKTGIPLIGDRADAGHILTHVNENALPEGVELGGGRYFGKYNTFPEQPEKSSAWASDKKVVNALSNQVKRAAMSGSDVLGINVLGSPTNVNFNNMVTRTLFGQLDFSALRPKDIAEFNAIVQKSYPRFKGIEHPEALDQLTASGMGNMRKKVVETMDTAKFQNVGFPDVASTRAAVTDQDLMNVPTGSTGLSIAKLDPSGKMVEDPLHQHDTYPIHLGGEYAGEFEHPVDFRDIFTDFSEGRRLLGDKLPKDDLRSMTFQSPAIQIFDQAWLDKAMPTYEQIMKSKMAKGGSIHMKDGGSANLEDNIKDKIKDFYRKWKDSSTEMFGDYPMPLESSTEYKDTTPSPRMGPEGTTIYSKNHYAKGGSIEDDYKLADMFTAEPESGGLNYRDYPNPHGVRAFPIKDKQGNITGYGGEELPKYKGWLDVQKGTGKLKGTKVTEYSMDDAKGSFPTLTPLLSQAERDSVASGNVTPEIYAKAILWRDHMVEQGKSPFLNPEGFAKGGRPVTPQMELPSAQKVGQIGKILGNKALEQLKKETANPSTQMVRDVVLNTGAGIAGMPSDMIQGARGEPMKGYKPFNTSTKQQGTGIPMAGTENLEAQLAKYGLTSGTQRPLLENALMMFGPTAVSKVGKLAKLTKDLPVGLSIRDVSKAPEHHPFIGYITQDGKHEMFNEAKAKEADYHHSHLVKDMDSYDKDSSLRFVRMGSENRYTLTGDSAINPYSPEGKKQITELAKQLIAKGADPRATFLIDDMALPKSEAPYQNKEVGRLSDWFTPEEKKTEFHSTLNKTIDTHKMEAMSGPQWSAWLKSNAPKSAKKEAEATGLHDWLETQGKVSKEDVKAYTEANRPEVKAITRGNSGKMTFADNERLKDLWTRNNDSVRHREGEGLTTDEYTELMKLENMRDKHSVSTLRNQQSEQERSAQQAQARGDNATANMRFNMAEHFGNRADALELNPEEMGGGTKFNTWQLPGGENYKETTLALPKPMKEYNDFTSKLRAKYGEGGFDSLPLTSSEKATLDNLYNKEGRGVHQAPSAHAYGNEDSDINRVAHIRTNERLTPDDKKALFLEELQSDWAQQGRERGFATPQQVTPKMVEEYFNTKRKAGDITYDEAVQKHGYPFMKSLAEGHYNPVDKVQGVPSGPYVQDTKDWTALGLKHALKQAVDEGHDYLGWTTGEQQANRYDLSKHIDELYYNPETKELQGHKGTKTIFDKEGVEPEHLDELVGKDVAAKLTTMSPNWTNIHPEGRILSGLDLQVGGEGMKGYYDKIVPQTMNDIMKQIGSKERVKPIQIQSGEPKDFDINHTVRADGSEVVEVNGQEHVFDNAEDAQAFRDSVFQPTTHQGIEITPELREQIQSEGLPHYHDGGNVSKKVNLEDEFKIAQLRKNYG